MNTLYYGDNLNILRRYIKDESVDLIYLDPPFNSNRNYNVLFKDESGLEADSQIMAFEDTWHWSGAAKTYHELILEGDEVATMLQAFRSFIPESQMMAYLVMMAVRLKELHRVLKKTGSFYLHCDPTASHYLKVLLDTIFGVQNFQNEIIWKRTNAHSDRKQGNVLHFGRIHDVIFYYSKTGKATRNDVYLPYSKEYLDTFYRFSDEKGRYRLGDLTGPGGSDPFCGKKDERMQLTEPTFGWRNSADLSSAVAYS
jgi:adenine specific DNA methylase Mod